MASSSNDNQMKRAIDETEDDEVVVKPKAKRTKKIVQLVELASDESSEEESEIEATQNHPDSPSSSSGYDANVEHSKDPYSSMILDDDNANDDAPLPLEENDYTTPTSTEINSAQKQTKVKKSTKAPTTPKTKPTSSARQKNQK